MAKVKFTIDTNAKRVSRDMDGLGSSISKTSNKMSGMSGVAKKLGGALIGAATAGKAMQIIGDSFKSSSAAAMELSDAMTPLIALGDNAKNYRAVANEVNTLRQVFGATASEVSELTFNIQSGGAALDKTTQDGIKNMSLLSNRVAGFDTSSISKAALKAFNIFGKEVGSVTDVFNKFVITASDADANINELAGSMPELFAAAKGVGSSMDETLASVIALTPSAGGANKAMIQLRNMFLILKDAQLKGIITATDFKNQLVELGELPLAKQMQLMGRETFSSFTALTGATDIFESSMDKLSTTTGNALLKMKGLREEASLAFKISEKMAKFEQEKSIFKASDDAVATQSEFSERLDQFTSGLTGVLLKVGGFVSKGIDPTAGLLTNNAGIDLGNSMIEQGETEFVLSNLSRMNANQIRADKLQANTALQINKATQKTQKNAKEGQGI